MLAGKRGFVLIVRLVLLGICLPAMPAIADHPPLAPPTSVPEAWNVIRQCSANIETLIDTNQLREISNQVVNTAAAIKLLRAGAGETNDADKLTAALDRMSNAASAVIIAARQAQDPQASAMASYRQYQATVKEAASFYPADTVNAAVFICPMHPNERHLKEEEKCSLCRMPLVRRRLTASTIYEKPGEPSIVMSAEPDAPLHVGRQAKVKVRLAGRDGSPVLPRDLMIMHTERIHLLIVDRSLDDYHHEHPRQTETPGEYDFSFTPKRPGPYRIFADLVPAGSGIQEYVVADLKSDAPAGEIDDRSTRLVASVEGMQFKLRFDPKINPLRAGQPILGELSVVGPDGVPFRGLEPVMGAFGHFVGFNEDRATVIHVHPAGAEPTDPSQRGGPKLPFFLYAPGAGYMRFYAQVRIDGRDRFAAFGLNIETAANGSQ